MEDPQRCRRISWDCVHDIQLLVMALMYGIEMVIVDCKLGSESF